MVQKNRLWRMATGMSGKQCYKVFLTSTDLSLLSRAIDRTTGDQQGTDGYICNVPLPYASRKQH